MWVDYWGAKGYVGPPPPLSNYWGGGGGGPPDPPPLPTPMRVPLSTYQTVYGS